MKIIVTEGALLEKAVWGGEECRGLGRGRGSKGARGNSRGYGHVYYPDCGDGFTILYTRKCTVLL